MRFAPLIAVALSLLVTASASRAESLNTRREIEKANKETIPEAVKKIETKTGAKVAFELDTASFGDDEKAWSNLYLVFNRIVNGFEEVGKDQLGKDALAKGVKKIVVVKLATDGQDEVALKEGTLTVKSSVSDDAISKLHAVVQSALEKAL